MHAVRQARRGHALDGGADDGARPIDEMTEFADNTSAGAVNPVVRRDVSGIDARVDQHGLAAVIEEQADFFSKGGETAVEAHHHEWSASGKRLGSINLLDLCHLFVVGCQRLFDKHGFAEVQCLGYQARVRVMSREDE